MSRKGEKRCEYCGPRFARYPHRIATLLHERKPCCTLCKRDLSQNANT